MFETPLTVVGHIVTNPERRQVGSQEVMKFRVASNSRRRTADGGWEPGNSLFINVSCWGRLVTGVGAALGKGAPVIVVGHVYTSEYEDRDGNRRSSLEMRATAVGPDVSRAIVRIEKPGYTGPAPEEAPAGAAAGPSEGGADEEPDGEDEPAQGARLPLSA
ncbi:single-stranded DNA-binding protein [Mycobacterium sp. 050134]|uniref:single-stranded DNA-binding protein n=1 Tax=Mycobacterium sp. 050134 TaxID=3096111 RepID=UPI002EDB1344